MAGIWQGDYEAEKELSRGEKGFLEGKNSQSERGA